MERTTFLERMNIGFNVCEMNLIDEIVLEIKRNLRDIYGNLLGNPRHQQLRAIQLILRPIEQFMCQREDTDVFWGEYPPNKAIAARCCKLIPDGQISYSCIECATASKNALCMDCYRRSPHADHRCKVRMDTYRVCDCGDQAAFMGPCFCDVHNRETVQTFTRSKNLPESVLRRSEVVFYYLLTYVDAALRSIQPDDERLMEQFVIAQTEDDKVLVIHGGKQEFHETVTLAAREVLSVPMAEAAAYVARAYGEGTSVVCQGTHAECNVLKTSMMARFTEDGCPAAVPLAIRKKEVEFHRRFASDVIVWLRSVIMKSEQIRQVFGQLLLRAPYGKMKTYEDRLIKEYHPRASPMTSFITRLLVNDALFPPATSMRSTELILAAVYAHQEHYIDFAMAFCKAYPVMAHQVLSTMRVPGISFGILASKIFARPPAPELMTNHGLFKEIGIRLNYLTNARCFGGCFVFLSNGFYKDILTVIRISFTHLDYLLSCDRPPWFWRKTNGASYMDGLNPFLKFLLRIQNMDKVTRLTKQHVVIDPEWKMAFNIQRQIHKSLQLIQRCSGSDRDLLTSTIGEVALMTNTLAENMKNRKYFNVAGKEAFCINQNSETIEISVHQPIPRLLAGLCLHLGKYDIPLKYLWFGLLSPLDVVAFMQNPMRILAMVAEAKANMWVRNGSSLTGQLESYCNVKYRAEMFDKDIVILQIGASVIPPDEFLIHLIHKFGLITWFQNENTSPFIEPSLIILEDFLSVVIAVIGERYTLGVGAVSKADILKHEIMQRLALGRQSYSWLEENLPVNIDLNENLASYLDEIAIAERDAAGAIMISPKNEALENFNPVFYHYRQDDLVVVEDKQNEAIKLRKGDDASRPPCDLPIYIHSPPAFQENFATIPLLFYSDVMLHIMITILTRSKAEQKTRRYHVICRKVLHLVALALHEDRRRFESNDTSFPFLARLSQGVGVDLEALLTSAELVNSLGDALTEAVAKWTSAYLTRMGLCRATGGACPSLQALLGPAAERERSEPDVIREREQRTKDEKLARIREMMASRMAKAAKTVSQIVPQPNVVDALTSQPETSHAGPSHAILSEAGTSQAGAIRSNQGIHAEDDISQPEDQVCSICTFPVATGSDRDILLYLIYVQRSGVLAQSHPLIPNPSFDTPWIVPAYLPIGIHVKTCGHAMHKACWERYVAENEAERVNHYDTREKIFACPICRRRINATMPVIKSTWRQKMNCPCALKDLDQNFDHWLDAAQRTAHNNSKKQKQRTPETFHVVIASAIGEDNSNGNIFEISQARRRGCAPESAENPHPLRELMRLLCKNLSMTVPERKLVDHNQEVSLWISCAYTIQMLEQTLRLVKKPFSTVFGSTRDRFFYVAMVRCAIYSRKVLSAFTTTKLSKDVLKILVRPEIPGPVVQTRSATRGSTADADRHWSDDNVLALDLWHLLVVACLSLTQPSEVLNSSTNEIVGEDGKTYDCFAEGLGEQYLLRLLSIAHIVQIITSDVTAHEIHNSAGQNKRRKNASSSVDQDLSDIVEEILEIYSKKPKKLERTRSTAEFLENYLKEASLPFFRCAVLFFSFLTDVYPSEDFMDMDFESLCSFLGLPAKISILFGTGTGRKEIMGIVQRWCHISSSYSTSSYTPSPISYPLTVKPLLTLPTHYELLVQQACSFTCEKDPYINPLRNPLLCLLCGTMVCAESKCCGNKFYPDSPLMGAANYHGWTCGMGTCIFLRVTMCNVVLLSTRKGGLAIPAPYVDEYGESLPVEETWSGCPMILSEQKYTALQKTWIEHRVHEQILTGRQYADEGKYWRNF